MGYEGGDFVICKCVYLVKFCILYTEGWKRDNEEEKRKKKKNKTRRWCRKFRSSWKHILLKFEKERNMKKENRKRNKKSINNMNKKKKETLN